MNESSESAIDQHLIAQRTFFNSHQTKSKTFRMQQLKKLKDVILDYEERITDALWKDLRKSPEEAYLTEISMVLNEIKFHRRNLKQWMKPEKVPTPLHLQPSKSSVYHEPFGVSLIVSPWNYPFQLLINPLIGAIAAGCCAILKPSPHAPNSAKVVEEMIAECFTSNYVSVIQGGKETNIILFRKKFDFIFFTGSPKLGSIVMKAASEFRTPLILELGGKSPCIVDSNSHVDLAAKRIVWGKFLNAGQTCIAPDYLMVHESVKTALYKHMIKYIKKFYGEHPEKNQYYARIVHDEAMDGLLELLENEKIIYGGEHNKKERYMAPTIIELKSTDTKIMQEEIFGPLLPVFTFSDIDEAINYVNNNEKPLALYYFGKNKNTQKVLQNTSSGGVCINNTLLHIANHHLPFGGVGNSGLGRYHGKESFLAFSNRRAVLKSPTWMDLPFQYPPFKYFKWIKKIL